jgi:polyphosphate kinase 2 (PPK2 family)
MSKGQQEDAGTKLKRKEYEKELRRLQAELCILQDWNLSQNCFRSMVIDASCTNPRKLVA